MDYSLIIPIYNEDNTLNSLLSELKEFDNNIEIIIINDGSTDKTKSILENQNNFNVIHNDFNRGKGFSIIRGVNLSTRSNIILMDGDQEVELKSLSTLINEHSLFDDHVVVGSRWNKRSKSGANINTYGNFLINYFFNKIYSTSLKDVLCCVKIINKTLLKSLKLKSSNFNIEMEIMSKLALKKINFIEKNVIYKRRKNREGKKIKLSDGWGIIWEMLKNKYNKY